MANTHTLSLSTSTCPHRVVLTAVAVCAPGNVEYTDEDPAQVANAGEVEIAAACFGVDPAGLQVRP